VATNRQDPDRVRGAAVIDALPGLGKTTIANTFTRDFDRAQRRRHGDLTDDGHERLPVFRVGLTSRTTLRTLNRMICEFYGHPGTDRAPAAQLASSPWTVFCRVTPASAKTSPPCQPKQASPATSSTSAPGKPVPPSRPGEPSSRPKIEPGASQHRLRGPQIDATWLRTQITTLRRTNTDIAAELGLSHETIRRHRKKPRHHRRPNRRPPPTTPALPTPARRYPPRRRRHTAWLATATPLPAAHRLPQHQCSRHRARPVPAEPLPATRPARSRHRHGPYPPHQAPLPTHDVDRARPSATRPPQPACGPPTTQPARHDTPARPPCSVLSK
jgi:AAA domain